MKFGGHEHEIGRRPLESHHPVKLDDHRHCASENIMFLISQVLSQEHVTQEL